MNASGPGPGQLCLFKLPPWGRGGSLSGIQSPLSALPEGMIPLAVVTLVDSDYVEIDSLTWQRKLADVVDVEFDRAVLVAVLCD